MSTRRALITRFAAAAVVAVIPVGILRHGAGAEVKKNDDLGGYGRFKSLCQGGGGTFTDTEDGNTWCTYPDGEQVVCDSNGNDCWHISRPAGGYSDGAHSTGTSSQSGDNNSGWEPLGSGEYHDESGS